MFKLILKKRFSSYDSMTHSLMNDIFSYGNHQLNQVGYIIKESVSKSLILINPFDYEETIRQIKQISNDFGYKLTHILLTDADHHQLEISKQIKNSSGIQIVLGKSNSQLQGNHIFTLQPDILPFSIGDLCVCFMHSPGYSDDYHLIAITQVNQNSTKLPALFTGFNLEVGSIGFKQNSNIKQQFYSLQKLKNFTNETLIFPNMDNALKNYNFAKALEPKNEFLDMKIDQANQFKQQNKFMIPTTIMEERLTNPFLRCQDKYFQNLIEEKDPSKVFQKLQKLKQQYI